MMAQDMFEENKVLQAEVDGFRSLIEEVSNFLLTLNVTNSVEDREVGRLQELIRSIDEDDEDEETCEVCTMWKPQCECEGVSDD